jgi:hypothetical protein
MTTWQIIRWWELRRIPFNAVLLVVGVMSLLAMEWLRTKTVPFGLNPGELETGITVVVYAVMANLCYTLGWIVELAVRKSEVANGRRRARKLFAIGLCFSCLVTSVPLWFGLAFLFAHGRP